MGMKYEVDGNIFREINEKWPFAYVSEFLIKARAIQTDEAGNRIEVFQLNDGRCFSRLAPVQQKRFIFSESNTQPRMTRATSEGG
jgi:hypothetical protein